MVVLGGGAAHYAALEYEKMGGGVDVRQNGLACVAAIHGPAPVTGVVLAWVGERLLRLEFAVREVPLALVRVGSTCCVSSESDSLEMR